MDTMKRIMFRLLVEIRVKYFDKLKIYHFFVFRVIIFNVSEKRLMSGPSEPSFGKRTLFV